MLCELSGSCARSFAAAVAFAAVAGASTLALAVEFSGSYEISARRTQPGLAIQTAKLAESLNFVLMNVGDLYEVDLFDIWTDEMGTLLGQDLHGHEISVSFIFDTPGLAGTVFGRTRGELYGIHVDGSSLFGGRGVLGWLPGPDEFAFRDGGVLSVGLTEHLFNAGVGLGGGGSALTPGREHGATVRATFTLVSAPVEQIPLPAALPLFASALVGLALLAGGCAPEAIDDDDRRRGGRSALLARESAGERNAPAGSRGRSSLNVPCEDPR